MLGTFLSCSYLPYRPHSHLCDAKSHHRCHRDHVPEALREVAPRDTVLAPNIAFLLTYTVPLTQRPARCEVIPPLFSRLSAGGTAKRVTARQPPQVGTIKAATNDDTKGDAARGTNIIFWYRMARWSTDSTKGVALVILAFQTQLSSSARHVTSRSVFGQRVCALQRQRTTVQKGESILPFEC